MKYFKDQTGAVYAFNADGSQDEFIPDSLIPITGAEADAIRAPTEAELLAQYEAALDAHLDSVAQAYRYADRTRLALRAGYPNQHQVLATAFGTWMDNCNNIAKQLYIDVQAGNVAMPTIPGFIASLPAFVAPS